MRPICPLGPKSPIIKLTSEALTQIETTSYPLVLYPGFLYLVARLGASGSRVTWHCTI